MSAVNSYNSLNKVDNTINKSLEKLSTGLRINRAGDDAAGLAISEKMRGQVNGLNMATRNSQDGISMIQTAEGALNETHSILQRMRELAVQSSNGTNTAEDREALQSEISELKSEIDRIGNTTEFNTQKLLDGTQAGVNGAEGTEGISGANVFKATKGKLVGVASATDLTATGAFDYTKTDALLIEGKKVDIQWSKYLTDDDKAKLEKDWSGAVTQAMGDDVAAVFEKAINAAIADSGTGVANVQVTSSATAQLTIESTRKGSESRVELYVGDGATLTAKLSDGVTDAVGSTSVLDNLFGNAAEMAVNAVATSGEYQLTEDFNAGEDYRVVINGHAMQVTNQGNGATGGSITDVASNMQVDINSVIADYNTSAGYTSDEDKIKDVEVKATTDGRIVITSPSGAVSLEELTKGSTSLEAIGMDDASREGGATGSMTFQIGANKGQTMSFSIKDMRSSALGIGGIDVSTSTGAQNAITALDKAISTVSSQRAKLGAVQNRLEHTINNLTTSSENLQSAESRVRDVDMSLEMVAYSKNKIISQAANSMLAQANQNPQNVLSLLR